MISLYKVALLIEGDYAPVVRCRYIGQREGHQLIRCCLLLYVYSPVATGEQVRHTRVSDELLHGLNRVIIENRGVLSVRLKALAGSNPTKVVYDTVVCHRGK